MERHRECGRHLGRLSIAPISLSYLATRHVSRQGSSMPAVILRTLALPTFRHLIQDLAAEAGDACGARLIAQYGWFSELEPVVCSGDFDLAFATPTMTSRLERIEPSVSTIRTAFCRL